jgi:hypothetical protein
MPSRHIEPSELLHAVPNDSTHDLMKAVHLRAWLGPDSRFLLASQV